MGLKKRFSPAPFLYMFLQLLLLGTCIVSCEKLIDFNDPYIIFTWIIVGITLLLYFFVHLRDPGFLNQEMILLNDGSSRTPKVSNNNMISLYSTFRNRHQDEQRVQPDLSSITRQTPKTTEQDVRYQSRKNQYVLNKEKLENIKNQLTNIKENKKYTSFADEDQFQNQFNDQVQQKSNPQLEMDIIKEDPNSYQNSAQKQENNQEQQDQQQQQQQQQEENEQQQQERYDINMQQIMVDQQMDDYYRDNEVECENSIMETENLSQNHKRSAGKGLTQIINQENQDENDDDLQQDFEINFNSYRQDDINQSPFKSGSQPLSPDIHAKRLDHSDPNYRSQTSNKKSPRFSGNRRPDKRYSSKLTPNSDDLKKQNTDYGTTMVTAGNTTAFTTNIVTKGNQEMQNINNDQQDGDKQQQKDSIILHLQDENKVNHIEKRLDISTEGPNIMTTEKSPKIKQPPQMEFKSVDIIQNPEISTIQKYNQGYSNSQSEAQLDVRKASIETIDKRQLQQLSINPQHQEEEVYIEKRYCQKCNLEQLIRSKHCQDCGRCVACYDHHCPWLGTCVGERNKCSFYWYLLFQFLELVLPTIQTIKCLSNDDRGNFLGHYFFTVIALLAIIGFGFMVAILIIYHTFLMCSNLTTWENVSWYKISYLKELEEEDGSPFSEGVWKNIKKYCRLNFFGKYTLENWTYKFNKNKQSMPQSQQQNQQSTE